jgi:hypothetical protein
MVVASSGRDISFSGSFRRTFPTVVHDRLLIVLDNDDTFSEKWVEKKKRKNGEIYCVTHTHEKSANAMTIRLDKDMNDKYVESRKKKEKLRCTDAPEHNR